jgi:hypothetical protein
MLRRRCGLLLCAAAPKPQPTVHSYPGKMKHWKSADELESADERAQHARHGKAHHLPFDPIANKNDLEVQQSRARFGSLQEAATLGMQAHSDELRQWMDTKHAALILELDEKKLFGLKAFEVEEQWTKMYARAANEAEKQEITAAAELLIEYSNSDVAIERTKVHMHEHLRKAKKEIDATLKEDKEKLSSWMFRAAGFGHLAVTCVFMVSMVAMYRYLKIDDASSMIERARKRYVMMMSQPTNDEPAPNYITRYRDTPSSLEEFKAKPHSEFVHEAERLAIVDAEEAEQQEELFLAALSYDAEAEVAKQVEKRVAGEELAARLKEGQGVMELADAMVTAVPSPIMREARRAS